MSFAQTTRELDIRVYRNNFNSGSLGVAGILSVPAWPGRNFLVTSILTWLENNSAWSVQPEFTIGTNAPSYNNLLPVQNNIGLDPSKYRFNPPLASGPPALNQPTQLTPGQTIRANITQAGVVSTGTPFVGVIILGVWIQAT